MPVEPGQKLSHYRLVEKIGEGGMGVVHRAHDTRLQRDVALKVLPAGLLSDETLRGRFRREARALSKLNHPNIATVHDFDTQEGVDFLVMELIRGVTLKEKLSRGALPEKEVVHLGTQLAEGLAAAHDEGVMHRDLKPGNLQVTPDERLKIPASVVQIRLEAPAFSITYADPRNVPTWSRGRVGATGGTGLTEQHNGGQPPRWSTGIGRAQWERSITR